MNPVYIPKRRRPLSTAREGEEVNIIRIEGGRRVSRRLMEMGLSSSSRIKVVQNSGGPVIIVCKRTRMALGRGVSQKILVE